jgi:3-oxoacyl-(acyl-carrier-protein) synthase
VAGVGALTAWGAGAGALPAEAGATAAGRQVLVLSPSPEPGRDPDRFRRTTRECLLGIAAVTAALRDAGLERDAVRGSRTGLVYVTAAAYGASNVAFAGARGAVFFPYTAPSAVPAEVTIEFGLCGAYAILIGGADASREALAHGGRLLDRGECDRALVLAVETFDECRDLWARGRRVVRGPLTEAAVCVVLERAGGGAVAEVSADAIHEVRRRAGETLACAPLLALALARRRATNARAAPVA